MVEFAPDLAGSGDGAIANPRGFGVAFGGSLLCGSLGDGSGVIGEDGAAADAGEVLLVALHAAAPVALLLHEVFKAVLQVELGVGLGEVVEGDLVDLVERVALGPGDGGVAAEGEVGVAVDAFEVRLERFQQRVELGADDGRNPADDAVELFVALLRGEEHQEIHGDVDVLRVARDAELEAAAGRFVDAALDDFAVDGIVARRDREVHDADFELALGLLLERAGIPGAGGHEDGALLGEEEDGFVAAEAGVADLEVVGDLAEHLEPEGVGGIVEIEQAGFEGDEGVIVMAATNRSDVLDPALLRPGRFDRKILVGRPDVKGREAILKVHAKNKPLAKDVDLKIIAKQTPGFVGADLANLLNEAALLAARRNKKEIDASDVDEAEDRVIAGPAKRDRVISKKERETVAFHEAGHTIVGLVLNDARVVHKVTIVPRGRAGGYAIMLPKEDQMLLSKKDLKEQIAGLMGGRAAEELIFNQQSSGASNDFQQATQLARSMVTEYGMSEKLGPVQYEGQSGMFAGDYVPGQQPFSIDTSNAIDSEVKALCEEGMATAKKIIEEHKEQHRIIAEALLEYETLDERQILSLYKTGKMPAQAEDEFPSEKAATFEEAKEALIRKDAVKQEESHRDELEDEFPSEENLKQADSEDSDKSENETNEPKNDDDKDE